MLAQERGGEYEAQGVAVVHDMTDEAVLEAHAFEPRKHVVVQVPEPGLVGPIFRGAFSNGQRFAIVHPARLAANGLLAAPSRPRDRETRYTWPRGATTGWVPRSRDLA